MNLLKELAEKEIIIKLETQKCKEEFYNWYVENGGGTEYRSLKELDYNTIALWYWKEKDTSYYNYSSGKYDYTWKQLKQKYNIGDDKMTKEELFEGAGKYWIEAKNGEIGCVMEYGIVFRYVAYNIAHYNSMLKNDCNIEYSIIRVLKPKFNGVVPINEKVYVNVVSEINQLKPITTLDQLEQVRKQMCEKYDTSFYITNKDGKWKIRFNGLVQQIGVVGGAGVVVNHPKHRNKILREDNNFNSETNVYLDWEHKDRLTTNPFRAINLEKEGYELKLGGE